MIDLLWQVPLGTVAALSVLVIIAAHIGIILFVPWKLWALARRDIQQYQAYKWQRMNRAQRRQAMRG